MKYTTEKCTCEVGKKVMTYTGLEFEVLKVVNNEKIIAQRKNYCPITLSIDSIIEVY